MTRRGCVSAILSCVVASTACGDGDTTTGMSIERDSAGITIVESSSSVWSETGAWRLSDEPLAAIGVVEGDPEYQLYQVRSAHRLTDGRIAFLNGGSAELRIYGPDGRHLVTAGGSGSGPGEFRYPNRLIPAAADTLIVWDAPMGPISRFDPNGVFVRQEPFDRAGVVEALGPDRPFEGFEILPDGSLVISAYLRDGEPPEGVMYRPPLYYFHVTRDFTRVDSLGWYGGLPQLYVNVGGRRTNAVALFSTHASVAAGGTPMRIYAGNGEDYQVNVFSADGVLEAIYRRTDPPREISQTAIDAARERVLEWAESRDRRAETERSLAALPPQTHYPAWSNPSALMVDATGLLWVQDYPEPDADASYLSVFDNDGRWLGRVAIPPQFTVHEIGADYVLGVLRDETDVERVLLFGLEGRSAPPADRDVG